MGKKIVKTISPRFISFLVVSIWASANSQIIYTDIPDVTLKCSGSDCTKTYQLDLNNDRTVDFILTAKTSSFKYQHSSCGSLPKNVTSSVFISPQNLNNVAESFATSSQAYSASAMNSAAAINSDLQWVTNASALSFYSSGCYYCCECCFTTYGGNWMDTRDHYLGLRFSIAGQTFYGWARLSVIVNKNSASFKIMDYAYGSTPGVPILAGDVGAGSFTKSSSEKEDEINSNDFKIFPNPVYSSAIISFLLSKPEKISLFVYDANGKLVKTIADKEMSKGNHQITFDTKEMNAGIYLLRIQLQDILQLRKFIVIR